MSLTNYRSSWAQTGKTADARQQARPTVHLPNIFTRRHWVKKIAVASKSFTSLWKLPEKHAIITHFLILPRVQFSQMIMNRASAIEFNLTPYIYISVCMCTYCAYAWLLFLWYLPASKLQRKFTALIIMHYVLSIFYSSLAWSSFPLPHSPSHQTFINIYTYINCIKVQI